MLYLGADHGGFKTKERVKRYLDGLKVKYQDITPEFLAGDDYPDVVKNVVKRMKGGSKAILICTTGIGMSIAANRYKKVRAALCRTDKEAELSRRDNNANVLCFGAGTKYQDVVKTFLKTKFIGGRHQRRIKKIS